VILSASSQTDEEAKIRVQEAALITDFVARARQTEPRGILVVAQGGEMSDVQLRAGDVVHIPERTEVVLITGEVMVPQAVVATRGGDIQYYVALAGGLTERANDDSFLVLRGSGEAIQGTSIEIQAGDQIMVLPEVPVKNLQLAKTIAQIIFQMALAAATVGSL
jgi:hypothetical protein